MIKDIQKAFYNHTYQRYEIVAPNIYIDWQFNEMDLCGVRRSGYVDEIEIKMSRADFLADFKKTVKVEGKLITTPYGHSYHDHEDKPKHDALQEGLNHCNYFSFLMSAELAEKCEIPEYAGLYIYKIGHAGIGRVYEIKRAKLLHRRKLSDRKKFEIGKKMAYRYWHMNP